MHTVIHPPPHGELSSQPPLTTSLWYLVDKPTPFGEFNSRKKLLCLPSWLTGWPRKTPLVLFSTEEKWHLSSLCSIFVANKIFSTFHPFDYNLNSQASYQILLFITMTRMAATTWILILLHPLVKGVWALVKTKFLRRMVFFLYGGMPNRALDLNSYHTLGMENTTSTKPLPVISLE